MNLIEVSIVPDDTKLADIIASLEMVSTRKLPNTVRAIKTAVSTLEYTWKCYAMGAVIPGTSMKIKSINGEYAKSIRSKAGNLGGVVWSDSPYANSIENGTDAYDLKKVIPFGPKARQGKNGPYNIVPFRHGTPKASNAPMPEAMYRQLLKKIQQGQFQKSKVIGKKQQGKGKNAYKWGSKTKGTGFPNLEGMVVFNVSSGGQNRSEYVTFRVITANKPKVKDKAMKWASSWIVPSRAGYHLTKFVIANTKETITEIIKAGIEFDLTP